MTHLRIATFNLENLGERQGVALSDRLPILRPQLERLDADILCLQEVNARREAGLEIRTLHALDVLLEGSKYSEYHRSFTHQTGREDPRDVHNLVVLSRLPIVSTQQLHNDLIPPLDVPLARDVAEEGSVSTVRWERPLLHVVIDLNEGRQLNLINLHLRSPGGSYIEGQKIGPFSWKSVPGWAEAFYLSSLKRSGQALEVRLLIDRIYDSHPDALIMVCGDLNAEEPEVPLRILMASDEDTGNGALAERSLIALERGLPRDRAFSVIHHGRPQMLDHMLVSRSLGGAFRSMEIHNEALGDETVAYRHMDHPPESFHAPLVADFSFDTFQILSRN